VLASLEIDLTRLDLDGHDIVDVADLGDLNHDNVTDLAVGVPSEGAAPSLLVLIFPYIDVILMV